MKNRIYLFIIVLCLVLPIGFAALSNIIVSDICQNGWLRARLPDNTEVTKYFTSGNVEIDSTVSGTATGYISCLDDGKEYPVSFEVTTTTTTTSTTTTTTTLPPENTKNMQKYSSKEVFLISDKNWQDVLPLVPITTWTDENNAINKYPTLIFHEEDSGFDADSIIYFMQQYSPSKATIIGETPQELDNLLIADLELGAGLNEAQIQRTSTSNYLSYWESFDTIVYVENNYESALMASTYASLINAPLIIEGSSLDSDNLFLNRNVICVGDVSRTCYEQYTSEQLQQKYVDETNTDKVILVNTNDLDIAVTEQFTPEKSAGTIGELYSETSLGAPILASAKHEIIISTTSVGYQEVDNFIESKISSLGVDPEYLTIIASPNAIEMSKESDYDYHDRKWRDEVDNYFYGNLDSDTFQELAVGRIFSLTVSDVSSYLARDLFYSEIPKDNDFSIIWPGMPGNFWNLKTEGIAIEDIFEAMGLNSVSFMTDEIVAPTASQFKNKVMLTYLDHAWTSGGAYRFSTYGLENEQVWLNSPLVFMEGCGSCAFELAYIKRDLFCANLLRRGAMFHYGATVDASGTNWDPAKMIAEELLVTENVGQAVKKIRNEALTWIKSKFGPGHPYPWGEHDPWNVLIGDPTFNPNLEKPALEELTVFLNQIDNNYFIDIFVPEVNKNIEINYVQTSQGRNERHEAKLFNYPLGNKIGRIYRQSYTTYNNSNDEILREGRSDAGFLLFSIEIPEGYSIKNITNVKYIDSSGSHDVINMPVFASYSPFPIEQEAFNYLFYVKDEGSENTYYFKMDINYGGDPLIVTTQETIPQHQFKISLELEAV